MSYNSKMQKGNVLFLILIAVALFAALSYAVTQSGNSSGSDADSETDAVNAASITQYGTGIRTAVLRMTVDGTSAANMLFNKPADFGELDTVEEQELGVFYPTGGGATYQQAPAGAMSSAGGNPSGDWFFHNGAAITNVGSTATDLVAYLPGVKESICDELNERFGLTTTDIEITDANVEQNIGTDGASTDYAGPLDPTDSVTSLEEITAYSGEPYGCFQDTTTTDLYVYYHTLVAN